MLIVSLLELYRTQEIPPKENKNVKIDNRSVILMVGGESLNMIEVTIDRWNIIDIKRICSQLHQQPIEGLID